MDEGVGTDSKVNMLVSLMEALRSAVRAGGAETPILVHSASYPGGVTPHSTGTFSLDTSLAAHARFAVYYYDLNHVGNAIHLTAPSGTTFASVNMQEEDGDVNMIFVNLHNAEKGVWRYKVENRADSHQGLHIQVTAQPSTSNDVTVKVWTSQSDDEDQQTETQQPIVMYGEVKVGGISVLNAGVMATLQRLGTNATGGTYPPVHVPLLDLGTGDPDITRGDGIYSRYAPPLDGPSRYALTLSVDASKAVLALSHNHHAGSSTSQYSAYRNTASSSTFPSEPSHEGTTTYQSTGSSHDPLEDFHESQHEEKDSALASRELLRASHFNRDSQERLQSFSSSGRLDRGPENQEHINFIHSTDVQGSFVSSLHSIESHLEESVAPFQESGSPQSSSFPAYPSPIGRSHSKSTNNIKHKDLVSSEEHSSAGSNRYRGRSHAKVRSEADKARHHRRRRAGHEKEVSIIVIKGSGFSSGLGSGGDGGGERVAVIAGSVGGVLLVLLLLVSYCYCFPAGIAKRNTTRRQYGNDLGDENHKNGGNGQRPLVNGGSLLVTSASRGSVLLNMAEEVCRNDGSPSRLREANSGRGHANIIADDVNSPEGNEEFPRALEPQLRNANAEDSDTQRTLSMSIPDVTRVEPQVGTSVAPDPSQPQFFTLGRNAARNHSNSSSTSSRHSFHDRSTPSGGANQLDLQDIQQRTGGVINRYNNSTQNHFQQMQGQPLDQQKYHKPQPMQSPYDPRRGSGGSNPYAALGNSYRTPHEDSDAGSLCREGGSIGGDSFNESLLCDDRNHSPPPPAPSGPPVDSTGARTSPYTPLNRRSLAML
ncbi:uncharacterized protein LOC125178112 [Hyalella azteca]|uniref:Uncharacterized protein LOC125178112 n=1 Tax=Hyalella azteca TaxID=294128 RepID=A0A979FLK8_HYAAZ|nr:uncharacterized protein LOC125178112 [Hyalella azteca]